MEASQAIRPAASAVLVGHFNPAIFQPYWFSAHEIVAPSHADAASETALVSPELTVLQFPGFSIEALRERVTFGSLPDTPTASVVRDAAVNVFTILQHTPIRLVGMNTAEHAELAGAGWDSLRDVLAPLQPWSRVLPHSTVESMVLRSPRADALAGHVQITVEPSRVLDGGVWVGYNSHVDLGDDSSGARPAIAVLEEHWEDAMTQSRDVAESIRTLL